MYLHYCTIGINKKPQKRVRFNLTGKQVQQAKNDDKFNQNFEIIKFIVIGFLRRNNFTGLHVNLFVPYLCILLQTKLCIKPQILGQKLIYYSNGCVHWIVPQMASNYKSKFTNVPLFLPYSICNFFKYSNEKRIVFKFNWILKKGVSRTDTTTHIGIVVLPKTDNITEEQLLLRLAIPYTYTFPPEFRINCEKEHVQPYWISILTGSLKTRFDRMCLYLHGSRTPERWNIITFDVLVINKVCAGLHGYAKLRKVEIDINKQDCFVFVTSSFRVREHSYDLKMQCYAFP